jgi:HAE1 family hydrophobic/amphiphilic exporter-1
LAIGIVVDDAIVVVEAVHAKLDHGESSPKKATLEAMNEISGAVISITLVMSAVFLPVTFITGSTGIFYKQFGLTLAGIYHYLCCECLNAKPGALRLVPEAAS